MSQRPRLLFLLFAWLTLALSAGLGGWVGGRAAPAGGAPASVLSAAREVVTLHVLEASERLVTLDPEGGAEARLVWRTGSAFAFAPGGWLLTNAHVVERADRVEVRLATGEQVSAQVHAVDSRRDLAVVRVEGDAPAPLRAGPEAPVGAAVWAVGAPFELHGSVSGGLISGLARAFDVLDPNPYIQHDAAVNPGSSGGPLLDRRGRVVGVNTAVARSANTYQGVSFAIPAALAFEQAERLRDWPLEKPAFLGVRVRAAGASPDPVEGVLVEAVMGRSPAEAAGLQPGDVLLALDEERLTAPRDLDQALLDRMPGERILLQWRSQGAERSARVTLSEEPPAHRPRTPAPGRLSIDLWSGAVGGPY